MKLYLVQQRVFASGACGSTTEVLYLKGIYKNKEIAEKIVNKEFSEPDYIHNAILTEIDSDLFEGDK